MTEFAHTLIVLEGRIRLLQNRITRIQTAPYAYRGARESIPKWELQIAELKKAINVLNAYD